MAQTLVSDTPMHRCRRSFAALLRARECQLSAINEKHWKIIGHGPLGAKAEELMQKAWAAEKAGFASNPRVVLAMGFFEAFLERSGINAALARGANPDELIQMVRDGKFEEPEMKAVRRLVKHFHKEFRKIPLAVRSSAHGDALGTGIYASTFCANPDNEQKAIESLVDAIKAVLASEFSQSGFDFRRKWNLPLGMAVMIEPVFGQKMMLGSALGPTTMAGFAPLYGGFAYTSYEKERKACVFICAGLPDKAIGGDRLKIYGGDSRDLFRIEIEESIARCALSRDYVNHSTRGHVLLQRESRASITFSYIPHNALLSQNLDWMFSRLTELEKTLGKPQYIEWAVIEKDGQPHVTILQIADVPQEILDKTAVKPTEKTILSAEYVRGSGIIEGQGIVEVRTIADLKALAEYNKTHSGYAVVIEDSLLTSMNNRHPVLFSDWSNASVIIEVPERPKDGEEAMFHHGYAPEGHLRGKIDAARQIFIITRDQFYLALGYNGHEEAGGHVLRVWRRSFRVHANATDQKAVLDLI